MEPYEFTENGGLLKIFESADIPGAAAIKTDCTVRVQAHELAKVVAALYEAAGQPVPDLPVIHDQAEVESLAGLMRLALGKATPADLPLPVSLCEEGARYLLAHGVRLPESTDA